MEPQHDAKKHAEAVLIKVLEHQPNLLANAGMSEAGGKSVAQFCKAFIAEFSKTVGESPRG